MASLGNLRVLVVIVIFFSLGFGLYTLAAAETPTYFNAGASGTGFSDSSLNPNSLLAWNMTNAVELNASTTYAYYDLHGWSWTAWTYSQTDTGIKCLLVETYDDSWGFLTNREDLHWYNNRSEEVSVTVSGVVGMSGSHVVMLVPMLDTIYGYVGMVGYVSLDFLKFDMTNSKGTFNMQISFNEAIAYAPSDALAAHTMKFSINQDFSDRKTSVNLLDLAFKLFTFQTPSMPYPLNILFSAIWIGCVSALAYVILSIIRSFIPFLGGGD